MQTRGIVKTSGFTSREETRGQFCKRVVLANVPSFRFLFWGNMRTYPGSGFRSGGTSECTLVPVFVLGEHPPKPPFWKTTLLATPEFHQGFLTLAGFKLSKDNSVSPGRIAGSHTKEQEVRQTLMTSSILN